jgi:hypothetical protein
MGLVCQVPTATEVRVFNTAANPFMGYRAPAGPRDGLYVFIENDPDKSSDDGWVQATVTSVAPGNVCPGGAAGYTFTISPAVGSLTSATVNAPVRTWEDMTLSIYQSGAEWYLGAESNSGGGGRQPVLGPLVADSGFTLQYLNASGVATATTADIRSIKVTFRGLSDQKVVKGAGTHLEDVSDSIVTQVVLRNALR